MTTDNQKIAEEQAESALRREILTAFDAVDIHGACYDYGRPNIQGEELANAIWPLVERDRARLEAENARLVAALDKIRALAVDWKRQAGEPPKTGYDAAQTDCASEIRRILDGSETP